MKPAYSFAFSLLILSQISIAQDSQKLIDTRSECRKIFDKDFEDEEDLAAQRRSAKVLQDSGEELSTEAKTVLLNADRDRAGLVIEMGSWQETANFLNHGGSPANTMIDTPSHTAKRISNFFYGKSKTGFVSHERLSSALDYEQKFLEQHYFSGEDDDFKPDKTKFFAFVVTAGTAHKGDGHAWVGIRFQSQLKGPWQTVKLHVRLLDRKTSKQNKMLGVLGVNLIYAVFHQLNSIDTFMNGLRENIRVTNTTGLVIDGMHFDGPEFVEWTDNRVAVALLKTGLSESIYLNSEGQFVPPSQRFYKQAVLLNKVEGDFTDKINPNVWANADQEFSKVQQIPTEKINNVNWACLSDLRDDKNGLLESKALEVIAAFQKLKRPVILTKFNDADRLSEWSRAFNVKSIGILQPTSKAVQQVNDEQLMKVDDAHMIRYLVLSQEQPAK